MNDTPKLNWEIPAEEWNSSREFYDEGDDVTADSWAEYVKNAVKAYLDADGWEKLERELDRKLRGSDLRQRDGGNKKNLSRSAFDTTDTVKVGVRVPRYLKEEMKAYGREAKEPAWLILTYALYERRHGGRRARCMEKVRRLPDADDTSDVEAVDAPVAASEDDAPDTDDTPEESEDVAPTSVEGKVRAICGDVGEQYTRDDVDAAISKYAATKGKKKASKPTLEKYRKRVADELGTVLHPVNKSLYLPREQAEAFAEREGVPGPSAPAIDREDYSDLDRDEKTRGILISLVRKASRGKARQLKTADVHRDVFDKVPTKKHVRDLIDEAASEPGFSARETRGGEKALVVSPPDVHHDVLDDAGVLADESRDEFDTSTPTTEAANDRDERESVERDTDARFDELLSGTTPVNAD
ncbi:hypothetical protein SAMN05421858_5132 [Haladaptatus litoreus]|uniref:Uncharacterized protein n=1 Tax=Haladaptatus litoreus TaxID=553468 RepID=A0A1N7FKD6_9EURY|nr:hypothetical protein [Haladaptatus litoreus]SIS00744.1 hypothetical protein SAMN05421858_5132 [Haladaptatus litoreus]